MRLSIEKEEIARQTLMMRVFFRQFASGDAPEEYYDFLKSHRTSAELFEAYPREAANADREAWKLELNETFLTTTDSWDPEAASIRPA